MLPRRSMGASRTIETQPVFEQWYAPAGEFLGNFELFESLLRIYSVFGIFDAVDCLADLGDIAIDLRRKEELPRGQFLLESIETRIIEDLTRQFTETNPRQNIVSGEVSESP